MRLADPQMREAITYGFRSCTSRMPTASELKRLEALYSTLKKRYASDPAGAKKLGGTADRAAWTLVASVLLNLDETITKG